MSYVDKFMRMKRPDSGLLDASYSANLSYDILKQGVGELLGLCDLEINEPYIDEDSLKEWFSHIDSTLESKLFNLYFRPELINGQNLPVGGAMVVGNHSGMFAWDGLSVGYAVWKGAGRALSVVGHDIFDKSSFLKTIGAIGKDSKLVVKLLKEDRLVFAFPGGVKETIKPCWERYNVQRVGGFAPGSYGYLLVALEARKPIVPLGVVGAEETHVQLGDIKPYLDGIVGAAYSKLPTALRSKAKRYKEIWDSAQGCPFLLNIFPFPSKISVLVGEPIHFYEALGRVSPSRFRELRNKQGLGYRERKELACLEASLHDMNERVLSSVQYLIDAGLRLRKQRR